MRLGVEAALVDGELVSGDVEVVDGTIAGYGLPSANGGRGIAVPGFVDLQVNGFAGVDFPAPTPRPTHEPASTAGDRRNGIPADVHHGAGSTADRRAAHPSRPTTGPRRRVLGVHLEDRSSQPSGQCATP